MWDMQIKLYFDYKSPYSYLGKDLAYQLERDYNVTIDWFPCAYDFSKVFGELDKRTESQTNRVKYLYLDVRRIAETRNLIIKPPKKYFDSSLAAMGGLFAKKQNKFRAYTDLVFDLFWKRELDIEDKQTLAAIMKKIGLSSEAFLVYLMEEGPNKLKALHQQAKEDKIFGFPLFIVEGEPFFGQDRIDWVRRKLDSLGLGKQS